MKRRALQNKQVGVLRMALRARKVFGTFEKRAHRLNGKSPISDGTEESVHSLHLSSYTCNVTLKVIEPFPALIVDIERIWNCEIIGGKKTAPPSLEFCCTQVITWPSAAVKDMRIEVSTTHVSTVSSGQNTTASNNVYIQLIDVRGWFGWNMSGFLKSFVGTRIHVSKRLRALLKHSRKK